MERITRTRATYIFCFVLAVTLFLAGRLYYLQIYSTGGAVDNTTTFTTATRVRAARGDILDCNGNVLVTNRASYDLVINHYVLTNAENPNQLLYDLVMLCREKGIEYTDHFPVSESLPFTYTLDEYSSTWQGYFQVFLNSRGGLDSDITAPLLMEELRRSYNIPQEWSDEEARLVLGLRYELTLRPHTNLPNYVFASDVTPEALAAIEEMNIPGMNVEATTVREYTTEFAAHILGYVGAMNPEQWEYYQTVDRVPGVQDYQMDAKVGQAGFELVFEEELHGIDGWRYDTVTADGTVIRSWYDPAPQAGNNVEVTIDIALQAAGEEALGRVMQTLAAMEEGSGHDAEGAAVVAIDIKTGQVLVCGSYPTYDLNTYFENYNQIVNSPYNPLINRALNVTYPPGSTFKMAMVIAGIDGGYIEPDTLIRDLGVYTAYSGFRPQCLYYSNYGITHGSINASQALMVSCNYFFYELGDRMDIEFSDAISRGLGLGEATGVELFEYVGYRANPTTKELLYTGTDRNFNPGDRILSAIGQSDNRFTPMQLAVYTATLANQGVRYRATFLNRVISADHRTVLYRQESEIMSILEISDEAFQTYTTGMREVVANTQGTAYSAFRNYPIAIAAKTGTAQTGITGASDNGAFVCYAPFDDPQIAIAVYGEKAGRGGALAEVARAILDAYFGLDSGTDLESGENQLG